MLDLECYADYIFYNFILLSHFVYNNKNKVRHSIQNMRLSHPQVQKSSVYSACVDTQNEIWNKKVLIKNKAIFTQNTRNNN